MREWEGNEKNVPIVREREGNEKKPFLKFGKGKGKIIQSHDSGIGISGFHSWAWTGTGIPAQP